MHKLLLELCLNKRNFSLILIFFNNIYPTNVSFKIGDNSHFYVFQHEDLKYAINQ